MSDKPGFSRVGQTSADEQDMARIREILFGEQSRQTEQQFQQLDARLIQQQQALESLIEQHIGKLGDELQSVRSEMQAQDDRQSAALDALNETLGQLLARLDERVTLLDSDQQDARHRQQQDAADQTAALDALQQRSVARDQLAALLETLAGELRDKPAP